MSSSKKPLKSSNKQQSVRSFFTPKAQAHSAVTPSSNSAQTDVADHAASRQPGPSAGQKRRIAEVTPPLPGRSQAATQLVTPEQSAPGPAAASQGTGSAKQRKLRQLLDGGDRQSEQFRCAPAQHTSFPVPHL